MSDIPEPDGAAAEQGVLVWNGRIEELRSLGAESVDLLPGLGAGTEVHEVAPPATIAP